MKVRRGIHRSNLLPNEHQNLTPSPFLWLQPTSLHLSSSPCNASRSLWLSNSAESRIKVAWPSSPSSMMMFHHVSSASLADSWLASWPTWGPAVLAMHAMRRPTRLARSLALSLPNTFLLPLTLPPPEPAQHCLQLLQLSRSATWVLITRLLFPTSPLLLRYYKNTHAVVVTRRCLLRL